MMVDTPLEVVPVGPRKFAASSTPSVSLSLSDSLVVVLEELGCKLVVGSDGGL